MIIAVPGASRPFRAWPAACSTTFPIGPPPVCSTLISFGASLLARTITFDLSMTRPVFGSSSFKTEYSCRALSLSL